MALIPLDYLPVLDTISHAQSLSDAVKASTADLIQYLQELVDDGGDGPLFDYAKQAALVIDWSDTSPSFPEVHFEEAPGDLGRQGVVLHRAAVRFDVMDLVRGTAFDGDLVDIVVLLQGERWTSICENMALLHYGGMLADFYNMTAKKEAA
ncbi:hypothetical protein [Gellertiella hungarica]|uniref:Uncharacterized protein n=1 Tax=Gellertiella hungarica TaxID=1572859 RepID=A0A7W6J529_9HYPH|nr:hypothetical protein [Gellertiella hungarica]MBB4064041.1 hypothetical protein [Gellertiella hungarica]